jgi:hypothetical protein
LTLAVDNHSSRAGHSFDAHAIILGKKCIPFAVDHLEEKEPREKASEYKNQDHVKKTNSPAQLRSSVLSIDIGEQRHLNP